MKLSKKLCLAASLAGALFLAACGDDGSSGKPASEKDGTASVPTYDDLAHCTKSHYGEIVFVEEESAYFECTSEDWAEVDESKLDSLLAAASSSSGDEEKPKSSSSLKADSTETADVEKVEVDSITVKGFAQKGPFASGTAVTVYGLDSLLEKTKTKFTGKVSGDSGAFKVEKIVLPSQYALVEVSGYYQNEVTGKKTSGSKTTLSALVDLSEGKTVKANVNLFTDLEYARAKHLVLKEKFNVPAAKKRATKELLSVFGGKGDDDLTATALSLSDTTSAGQALLFASILLQGDLSASKFGILLGGIEEFFGSTGGLDSAEATAAFADWASKVDSTDNFAAIRENVKAMKLVAAVPDFESALYAFWTNEYGLGACTDSLESTIEKNSNKKSENYGAGYACTARRWHKATALDTELGLCTGKMEGQFKEYKGGKTAEYYVCKAGSWNKITETQYELKECTEDRNNEYVKAKSGDYFVCSGKQWLEIDALTYELKLCTEKRNNKVEKTKDGDYYKCVSGEWEMSDKLSYELQDAGACSDNNNLDTYETESFGIYVCDDKSWRKATELETKIGICGNADNSTGAFKKDGDEYYVCHENSWEETDFASYSLEKICSELNRNTFERTSDKYYQCAETGWQQVSELDYMLKKNCNESIENTFFQNSGEYYVCGDNQWTRITEIEYTLKALCNDSTMNDRRKKSASEFYECQESGWTPIVAFEDSRDGQIYKMTTIGKQTWMAENLNFNYEYKTAGREASSFCSVLDSCGKYGRRYLWSAAMDSAGVLPGNTPNGCGNVLGECSASGKVRGVCPAGWHLPSVEEFETLVVTVDASISSYDYPNNKAGRLLKATTGWPSCGGDNGNGVDTYGFSVYPVKYNESDAIADWAVFLSSEKTDDNRNKRSTPYGLSMMCSEDYAWVSQEFAFKAHNVRCVRD